MLAHPSGRLTAMFPPNLRFCGASATAARTLERPSGSPSANVPFEAKLLRRIVGVADSRLQRLSSDALLTAIKSASFPMVLLHGFLDRRSLRRKQGHYTKIAAVCGRSNVKSRLHFSSKRILNLILNRKKLLRRENEALNKQKPRQIRREKLPPDLYKCGGKRRRGDDTAKDAARRQKRRRDSRRALPKACRVTYCNM